MTFFMSIHVDTHPLNIFRDKFSLLNREKFHCIAMRNEKPR